MSAELNWIKDNIHKLSPLLVEALSETYKSSGWGGKILARSVNKIKNNMYKKPVIVQLKPDYWANGMNNDNLGGILGCCINHRLSFIDCFSTSADLKTIQKLAGQEGVMKIWYDREVTSFLDIASPVVGAPPVWQSGYQGKGVGIAIVDTGIYPHPDLTTPRNRIVAFKDFINGRVHPYDDNGHGTHCAGDAAGNGVKSGGKYTGPAPKANLIGVKVLNKQGSGQMSNVLAGIQWCIKNKDKYSIKIISMSVGSKATVSYKEDPLCRAVEKAWVAGLVVCIAAGNSGPGKSTVTSPGIDPKIITVGAIDDKNSTSFGDDVLAGFSGRGPTIDGLTKPDVLAPGVNIISLKAPNSHLSKVNKKSSVGQWYISFSGTSMATPICAGVAALMISRNPNLKPDEIKKALVATCRPAGLDRNSQGAGVVSAAAALKQLKGT